MMSELGDRAQKKLGIELFGPLGDGVFGEVHRTKHGVLKITRDPLELNLVTFGLSKSLPGLPRVLSPPTPIYRDFQAYEREELDDLGWLDQLLPSRALEQLGHLTVFREISMTAYDRIVWHDRDVEREFPEICEALRAARHQDALVFDLAPRNLGVRKATGETVIRDGRMMRLR